MTLTWLALSASAQVVSNDPAVRAGKRPPNLFLPARNADGAMLVLSCNSAVLLAAGLPAAAGSVDLFWRVDAQPGPHKIVAIAPLIGMIEGGGDVELRSLLRDGQLLTIRVKGPDDDLELEFDLMNETKQSFALAAQSAGAAKEIAELGLKHLSASLERAAHKRNDAFAVFAEEAGISLRDGDRQRRALEVLPDILAFLNANRDKPNVDELGALAFGKVWWSNLRPLLNYDHAAYRVLSGPIDAQLTWLNTSCRKAG
jgi:hypothetical protein